MLSFCFITDMAFFLEYVLNISIMFLLTISMCNADIQSVTTTFTEMKSVATSHTTLQGISKIKCVEKCDKERQNGNCTLAGYDKRTKTCYLSDDDPMNVLDTEDKMIGVFFYEQYMTGILCLDQKIYLNSPKCFVFYVIDTHADGGLKN